MPTQDGVRCDNSRDVTQCLSAQGFALNGQSTSLVVGQQNAFLPLPFQQCFDLLVLKPDDCLLLPLGPPSQDENQQLPGLQNDVHRSPKAFELTTLQHYPRNRLGQSAKSAVWAHR